MKFAVPEASVLIVDDNEINLEVTAALLEPLKMKIDLADSGKQALLLAQQKKYHLIFMDQMMPVMDGMETTRKLRRLPDVYYRTVPVIALTANALAEVREDLQKAGMNDYLAKPVEVKDLYRCVLKWLPRKMIVVSPEQQKSGGSLTADRMAAGGKAAVYKAPESDSTLPKLPGINPADGIRYTGSEKMWLKLLGDFYKLIDSKSRKLEDCVADGLIRDYTIEVHALKNTAL